MQKSLVFLSLILSLPLYAHSLDSFNNQASLEAQIFQFDYDETVRHKSLDSVKGSIPGARLSIRKQIKQLVLEPSFAFKQGDLEYHGGINGADTPKDLSSNTPQFFFNADGILGYIYCINERQVLMPYLHYGYRRWDREVPPIGYLSLFGKPLNVGINSYTEIYQHHYGLVGVEFQQVIADNAVVSAAAGAGYTFNASLFTNMPTLLPMNTMGVTEGLGSKPIYELKVKLDYEIRPHFHILTAVNYVNYAYGKSKVIIYTYEPNSSTNELTGSLGIGVDLI